MLRAAAWLLFLFIVAPAGCVLILRWVDPPMTWTIWRSKTEGPSGRDTVSWQPIPLERMGPHAPIAVIAAEDQRFTRHKGFDLAAIKGAIEYNRRHEGSKRQRGGSTISQQTAKNVFLWQGRTWVRKAAEAYFTALIEMMWGKRRILEVYLNCAEMGDGVFGIEAAARRHFHKAARELTREEAALIAASLPAPRKHNVTRPGPWLRKRQRWVLEQMSNLSGDRDLQELLAPRTETKTRQKNNFGLRAQHKVFPDFVSSKLRQGACAWRHLVIRSRLTQTACKIPYFRAQKAGTACGQRATRRACLPERRPLRSRRSPVAIGAGLWWDDQTLTRSATSKGHVQGDDGF